MPLFSVIVPVCNRFDLLKQALESVQAQMMTDFEVIVVDDGSTDSRRESLKALGPGIRIFEQSNQGPGSARNLGAEQAKGDYLAFLDSDDLWFPWALAAYAECISKYPEASIIGGRGLFFESESPDVPFTGSIQSKRFECLFSAMRNENVSIPTSAIAFRRDQFLTLDGFKQLFVGEDMDLWLRAGCLPEFVFIKHPPVFAEREHSPRISSDLSHTLNGIGCVLNEERSNRYAGGIEFAPVRETRLAMASRSISLECLKQGRVKEAWSLYRQTLAMNVRLGRWRYLAGFPFFAGAKAIVGRRTMGGES